jgi:hypothetical protein
MPLSAEDMRVFLEGRLASGGTSNFKIGAIDAVSGHVFRAVVLDASDRPVLDVEFYRAAGGILILQIC